MLRRESQVSDHAAQTTEPSVDVPDQNLTAAVVKRHRQEVARGPCSRWQTPAEHGGTSSTPEIARISSTDARSMRKQNVVPVEAAGFGRVSAVIVMSLLSFMVTRVGSFALATVPRIKRRNR
jgi:hypothetical protein